MASPAWLPWRPALRILLLPALALLLLALPAAAAPIKAEVSVSTANGFARLILRMAEEVEAEVRLANGILVITFKQQLDVSGVDYIPTSAPGYINAARRDPDGTAVRLALGRKVTVNTMAAGELLFVDLLPEGWTGLPPGLPQDVVDNLARRAREAEKKARRQQALDRARQQPVVRVRVGTQPTFTRYVFELPELIAVSADRSKDRLTLSFDSRLKFDLADAQAMLPPSVIAIGTQAGEDDVSVRFELAEGADIRTFREDNSYIVDVLRRESNEPRREAAAVVERAPMPPAPAAAPPPPVPADARLPVPARIPPEPRPPSAVAPPLAQPAPLAVAPAPLAVAAEPVARVPVPQPRPSTAPGPRRAGLAGAQAVVAEPPAAPPVAAPPPRPAEVEPAPERTVPQVTAAVPLEPIVAAPPAAPPAAVREPAAEPPKPVGEIAAAPAPAPRAPASGTPVAVELRRQGDTLRISFPFPAPVSAAVFRRADTVWLIFDSILPIDIAKLITQPLGGIRSASVMLSQGGQVVRIKVDRPKLTTLEAEGAMWTVSLGETVLDPTQPLVVNRSVLGANRSSAVIPFEAPQKLHRIADQEAGDTLLAVTGFGPARGLVKPQDFVEFRTLASTHGVAVQPIADDVEVQLEPDKIVIGRPAGLIMSNAAGASDNRAGRRGGFGRRPPVFDPQLWGFDRQANFIERKQALMTAAAEAPPASRSAARLDLARFYLARDMNEEAKGVLDVLLADEHSTADEASALMMRAIAGVMMRRGPEALKDLSNPAIGALYDVPLWRALAYAREGRWVEAREGLRTIETAAVGMPIELQRFALKEAARAAVEVRDFADADTQLHMFETVGVPRELEPTLEVIKGRIDEGLGRTTDALNAYRAAADSWDRPAAAQGRLREIALRYAQTDVSRPDAIAGLEQLTTSWRGDDTEIEALQLLGRLYTEEGRYRDAFHVMRAAMAARPGSELTHRIQDEAAATFDALFLAGKADSLPAVDALSLFYDFRELTPVGRRGDEMIRRLADRLVSVDLLDQAAALLQHQVDHRLQGAARAQVAIRLAMIYLMAHKPDRAVQNLRATQTGGLPDELRRQRLLLEARGLSDTGRHDLALELVSNLEGKEVDRLRADILWSARRWRDVGEQVERSLAQRWREFDPLTPAERIDVLRGAIGYSLAEDAFGLERFREKYAPKMADGPDRRAFDVVTAATGATSSEFAEVARTVSGIDTLDSFLQEMRNRYPEAGAASPARVSAPPAPPAPPAPRPPQSAGPAQPRAS